MRGALLLAAWASVLAVAEPALDPVLQALYGPRQQQKRDVSLLQAKFGDDEYADSQAYDYGGADYGRVLPSRLLGRIFQRAGIDDYEDERTTLYCITVKPKPSSSPSTTPSTTPEVICFPPSRRTKTTGRTTTTATSTPIGKCDNGSPLPDAKTSTTAAPQHANATKHDSTRHSSSVPRSSKHSTPRPSSAGTSKRKTHVAAAKLISRSTSKATKTSHRTHKTTRSSQTTRRISRSTPRSSTHEHAPKHIPTVGNCGADPLMTPPTSTSKTTTTHKRTTAKVTSSTTRTTHKSSAKPKLDPKGCPADPQPEPTKTSPPTSTTPRTRPPVDEFLAAWGSFRHRNSLDPRNGSHWREFHNVDGGRAQQRRELREEGVLVIVPPWVRERPPGLQGQAFFAPPAETRLSKRGGGQPESAVPYRRFWYRNLPPAGGEVSRMPARDKENFAQLSSWWQNVLRTYNGHQRKKRAQVRR